MIFVAVLLLAQSTQGDRLFSLAQEEFVHSTGAVHSLDRVLPERHARLVRNLGCKQYGCRQEAEESLVALGDAGLRAAAWGCWSRDAEVSSRSERILAGLLRCEHCSGRGGCPAKVSQRWERCPACWSHPRASDRADYYENPDRCLVCRGTGDARQKHQGDDPSLEVAK